MGRTSVVDRLERAATAEQVRGRKEILKTMTAKLKRKLGQIERLACGSREANLRFYHAFGKILLAVRENQDNQYGENPVDALDKASTLGKRLLYKSASFAEKFDADELEWFIALTNEDAVFSLHWGHVQYLLVLETKRERQQFARRAVQNLWDPKALGAAVKRRKGPGQNAGPGCPHKLPATVHLQIRQILETTRNWVIKDETLWNGDETNVFANIEAGAEESFEIDDLDNLKAIEEMLPQMVQSARDLSKLTKRAVKRVDTVLQARASTQAQDKSIEHHESGRRQRVIDLGHGPRGGQDAKGRPKVTGPKTGKKRRKAATAAA